MLQNIKALYGDKLAALDGDIGRIKDFYFDAKTWAIRYLVPDTGAWLMGRLILLSPQAVGKLDRMERTLHLDLRKKQIESSPPIGRHKPVSRQDEIDCHGYYGWPAYWNGAGTRVTGGDPLVPSPAKDERKAQPEHHCSEDRHLRSTKALTGYTIQATDGEIGRVNGFLADDKSWVIHELVVETGPLFSGEEILIAPARIGQISHEDSTVCVNLTKSDILNKADHAFVPAGTGDLLD